MSSETADGVTLTYYDQNAPLLKCLYHPEKLEEDKIDVFCSLRTNSIPILITTTTDWELPWYFLPAVLLHRSLAVETTQVKVSSLPVQGQLVNVQSVSLGGRRLSSNNHLDDGDSGLRKTEELMMVLRHLG